MHNKKSMCWTRMVMEGVLLLQPEMCAPNCSVCATFLNGSTLTAPFSTDFFSNARSGGVRRQTACHLKNCPESNREKQVERAKWGNAHRSSSWKTNIVEKSEKTRNTPPQSITVDCQLRKFCIVLGNRDFRCFGQLAFVNSLLSLIDLDFRWRERWSSDKEKVVVTEHHTVIVEFGCVKRYHTDPINFRASQRNGFSKL